MCHGHALPPAPLTLLPLAYKASCNAQTGGIWGMGLVSVLPGTYCLLCGHLPHVVRLPLATVAVRVPPVDGNVVTYEARVRLTKVADTCQPRQAKELSCPYHPPPRPRPLSWLMICPPLPAPPLRLLSVLLCRELPLRLGALRVKIQVTMWLPLPLCRQLSLSLGALRVCGALQVTIRLPSRCRASTSQDAGRVPTSPPAGHTGRWRRRTNLFVSAAALAVWWKRWRPAIVTKGAQTQRNVYSSVVLTGASLAVVVTTTGAALTPQRASTPLQAQPGHGASRASAPSTVRTLVTTVLETWPSRSVRAQAS